MYIINDANRKEYERLKECLSELHPNEDHFLVKKENVVMTGTTNETLGSISFIIYRSGKANVLYVSTQFMLTEVGYFCRYANTKRLCDDSTSLRHMRVDDIEQKAYRANQGKNV